MAADRSGSSGPAGIPNFAWIAQRRLARGRQPALSLPTYRELREYGFSAVLSLRPEREYPDDDWRSYDAADERALCEAAGLSFHHVACRDFQAPHPSEVVRALAILHREIERGQTIFMHCFAGVGRTGVVSGAWQMLRGASGTEALRQYAWFCEEVRGRAEARRLQDAALDEPSGGSGAVASRSPADFLHTIGAHHQAWVLLTIAETLGLPAEPPVGFIEPQPPPHGKGWGRRFRDQLQRHLPSIPVFGPHRIAGRDAHAV